MEEGRIRVDYYDEGQRDSFNFGTLLLKGPRHGYIKRACCLLDSQAQG